MDGSTERANARGCPAVWSCLEAEPPGWRVYLLMRGSDPASSLPGAFRGPLVRLPGAFGAAFGFSPVCAVYFA